MHMHTAQYPRWWPRVIRSTSRILKVDPETAECVLIVASFLSLIVLVMVVAFGVAQVVFRPTWEAP